MILKAWVGIPGKKVLDIGCGNGGTARVFATYGANVTAIDTRDELHFKSDDLFTYKQMSADDLTFNENEFDIVIMQDVVEHLPAIDRTFAGVRRILKSHGVFYISTPNRFSPLNFISDPHWNLPLISALPRKAVKWLVKHMFRIDRRDRDDWAALLSLSRLAKTLNKQGFHWQFRNTEVAKILFENPASVVCHPFHLKFVAFLKRFRLESGIRHLVNDRPGFFNHYINPTWYIVGWKS